jgi:hypothetical protein
MCPIGGTRSIFYMSLKDTEYLNLEQRQVQRRCWLPLAVFHRTDGQGTWKYVPVSSSRTIRLFKIQHGGSKLKNNSS